MADEKAIDISLITRRAAARGNMSYGDPVVLHDTSRKKVVMVPFFVQRSQGTDFAIKLVCYKKSKKGGMRWRMRASR